MELAGDFVAYTFRQSFFSNSDLFMINFQYLCNRNIPTYWTGVFCVQFCFFCIGVKIYLSLKSNILEAWGKFLFFSSLQTQFPLKIFDNIWYALLNQTLKLFFDINFASFYFFHITIMCYNLAIIYWCKF